MILEMSIVIQLLIDMASTSKNLLNGNVEVFCINVFLILKTNFNSTDKKMTEILQYLEPLLLVCLNLNPQHWDRLNERKF
jgi:hypothetical protein